MQIEWHQQVWNETFDDTYEERHVKRVREKKPHKCRLCGQLIFEHFLQGTSTKGGYGEGLKLKVESRQRPDGEFILAEKILVRITEEERQPHLRYWKEHRCPGFKS